MTVVRALYGSLPLKLFLTHAIYLCSVPSTTASIFAYGVGTACRYPAFRHLSESGAA
jgi:hypothetical protein